MPADSMTIAVTSGFGIGIIAGIVSGVCYILIHGLSAHRPSSNRSPWHCSVCGEQFRSIEGILETDKVVTCSKCHKKVCRKKCSNQNQLLWICRICQQPESWFKGILKALNPSYTQLIAGEPVNNMDVSTIDEVDEDLEVIKKKEKEQVREFIERLVEAMLGGGIDNVSVTRLYNDQKYDSVMTRYHSELSNTLTDLGSALHMSIANLPVIGQSPCSAHASLKVLIQRIIQEAISLSSMKKISDHPSSTSEINNRTYEDLLATAIINKVVENYQEELPTSSSIPNNKEYFFGEETLESKWKKSNSSAGDLDTASVSSLEEWVRSDSSTGSSKYVDHRSLTIKQGIAEVSSSDEDEVVHAKHKKTNWKENWTLQKRHITGTSSPIPVPMLVPNPTTEAKVLIGDREAEDTTDLSDVGSDYGDTEKAPTIDSLLVDSKTVIGGKNPDLNIQSEIQSDDSTDTSDIVVEKEQILEQLKSNQIEALPSINTKVPPQLKNAEPSSFDSHVEQDSEYTEKYATLPKTIIKDSTLCSSDAPKLTEESSQLTDGNNKNKQDVIHPAAEEITHLEESEVIEEEKFKGSYSEREKHKWENAVEMKNNPYTEENIKKRLTKSSYTDVSSLFGRDYYIKQASKAAGTRKSKEDGDETVSPKMQEPEDISNRFVYQAIPVIVDPDGSQYTESDSPAIVSPIRSSLLEISSDSDLSIERVYNLNSGKVYETVGGVHKEIVKRSTSPEGIAFNPNKEFDKTVTDENHNSTTLEKKRSFLKSLTEIDDTEETEYMIEQDFIMDNDNTFSDSITVNGDTSYETVTSDSIFAESHVAVEEEHILVNELIVEKNNNQYSVQEFTLEFSTDGENRPSAESSLNINSDPEIVDLKDKHLVKDQLGLFSKSYPSLASVPAKKTITKKDSIHATEEPIETLDTSVNDLRKKFDNVKNKDQVTTKQVHSLTARSISQTIRKELQEVDNDTPYSVNKTVITEEVITEEQVPNYFPNAKSRIKFFENLNR